MGTPIKHVGEVDNKRVVIVFLQLPERPDTALVVDADALPERDHEILMREVQSKEGQDAQNLYDLLGRRMMPSTNTTLLMYLHASNRLMPVPVSKVNLLPYPNHRVPLVNVLKELGKTVTQQSVDEKNFYQSQRDAELDEGNSNTAINLITQAEVLEQEARTYRERAYRMAPSLRPNSTVPAPVDPVVVVNHIRDQGTE
jgi:hypothetical protein